MVLCGVVVSIFGRSKMSATSSNWLAESTIALENRKKGPRVGLLRRI